MGPKLCWVGMSPNLSRQTLENRTLWTTEELSLGWAGRFITKEIRGIFPKSRRKGPKSIISNPMGIMMTLQGLIFWLRKLDCASAF